MHLDEYIKQNKISITTVAIALNLSYPYVVSLRKRKVWASEKLAKKIEEWTQGAVPHDIMQTPPAAKICCPACGKQLKKLKPNDRREKNDVIATMISPQDGSQIFVASGGVPGNHFQAQKQESREPANVT